MWHKDFPVNIGKLLPELNPTDDRIDRKKVKEIDNRTKGRFSRNAS